MPADARRAGDHALVLLGAAVLVACVGLGAPPRMEAVEGAPGWARLALESLLPLALVQVLILLAAARLVVAGALFGPRGGRAPLVALAAVAALGLVQLLLGATAWTYGTGVALVQVAGLLAASGGMLAAPARARVVLAFVATVAALECAYGVAVTHVGDDTVLGLAKVSSLGRVTGTFVMPSVLASLGALGACAALALALIALRERRVGALLLWVAVVVVSAAGVVLSLSRWMIVAAAAGLVVTMWLAGGALRRGGRGGAGAALRAAAVLVPAGGVAAALLVPALRQRFEFLLPYVRGEHGPVEPRFAGWMSGWQLFLDHPVIGTGLGSFGRAIHLTQSVDAPEELWYAHCEPLNVLSDVGVVGFALVAAWLAGLVLRGRRGTAADDPAAALLAAGAAGGAVAALVAGLGDFPTQFAPVALPFAAFLALPAALGSGEAAEPLPARPVARRALGVALVVAAVVPVVSLGARWGHVADGHAPGASRGERLLVVGQEQLRALTDARTPAEAEERAAAAAETLAAAAAAEPGLDATHLWEGLAHLTVLQLTTDRKAADARRDAALAAFAAARRVSRGHADVNLQIGLLYLDLLGTQPNPHGPGDDTAMAALREAGALRPQAFSRAWREALDRELPPAALEALVPERPHALRVWAQHLRRLGREAEADAILHGLESEDDSGR